MSQEEKLKLRLPDATDEEIESMLEDSKYIAFSLLYPFKDEYPEELPERLNNWQIRVCSYMYENKDFLGITRYSENGITIDFSSDNIPQSFLEEIMPKAGVI